MLRILREVSHDPSAQELTSTFADTLPAGGGGLGVGGDAVGGRQLGPALGRLSSWGEEVQATPSGHWACPQVIARSDDPGDNPTPAHTLTHMHIALLFPHLSSLWLTQSCTFISTATEESQRGLCAPPIHPCNVGIPTYQPEVPERDQIVTVRNMTELSKADKISHVNCETKVTVLFVLRE